MVKRSNSPWIILFIGIAGMVVMGLLMDNFIQSTPEVQKLLKLHSHLQKLYQGQVKDVKVGMVQSGKVWGTSVELKVLPEWEKKGTFDERSVQVAQQVFSFKVFQGRIFWTMPQTFVLVKETGERQSRQREVTFQEVRHYQQGKSWQKRLEHFLRREKLKSEAKWGYSEQGWAVEVDVKLPYREGASEKELRQVRDKVMEWVKNSLKGKRFLRRFSLKLRWLPPGPSVVLQSSFEPGKIVWLKDTPPPKK